MAFGPSIMSGYADGAVLCLDASGSRVLFSGWGWGSRIRRSMSRLLGRGKSGATKKSNLSEVHAPSVPSAVMDTTVMGFNWNRAGSEREGGGADGPARRRSEMAMMGSTRRRHESGDYVRSYLIKSHPFMRAHRMIEVNGWKNV